MLGTWLGLAWESVPEERDDVELDLGGVTGGSIRLPDVVFATPESSWPDGLHLPEGPLPELRGAWVEDVLGVPSVPVLFGAEGGDPQVVLSEARVALPVDVLGTAFVLLTRLEELRDVPRDRHGRFPASASLAWRLGFLGRPLVDEHVELLRAAVEHLRPGLVAPRPVATTEPSHDIDFVDARRLGSSVVLRSAGADLLHGRDPLLATRRLASIVLRPVLGPRVDPFNTFDLLMRMSEAIGARSTFFFICGRAPGGKADDNYEIDEPWLREILRRVTSRGHVVGLHGSYRSHRSAEQLGAELDALTTVLRDLGLPATDVPVRQHYLRLEVPETWRAQEAAGLSSDATSGYADAPGFRSGTSREHPLFDVAAREPLRLLERPLVLMDTTLLHPSYLGLAPDAAGAVAEELARTCRRVGGAFSILWHNTSLLTRAQRALYEEILRC